MIEQIKTLWFETYRDYWASQDEEGEIWPGESINIDIIYGPNSLSYKLKTVTMQYGSRLDEVIEELFKPAVLSLLGKVEFKKFHSDFVEANDIFDTLEIINK